MLNKYLISILTQIILILPSFAIAAANIVGVVKLDDKDQVKVEWTWNNNIPKGPPFNLIATPVNWSIQSLKFEPKKNITGIASHVVPPHTGERRKDISLCYELNLPQAVVAKAPDIGNLAKTCGVSTSHKSHTDSHRITIVPPQNKAGNWSATWIGVHTCYPNVRKKNSISTTDESSTCPIEPPFLPLSLKLISFQSTLIGVTNYLSWMTSDETNDIGFYLWRTVKNQYGGYEPALLGEIDYSKQVNPELNENCSTKIQGQLNADDSSQRFKLILAAGNSSMENTCYSFTDTSNLSDGTYYYLLESISDNGESTFHCKHIDAVTIGQGPAIDLESAINYCKEVTGSNN